MSFEIRPAREEAEMEVVRRLFREYADFLQVDLCFQGFEQELRDLPGKYAPPGGEILLAWRSGEPEGCVALRPGPDAGTCEMKRLWVRPGARGTGLGRRLAEEILEAGRASGYRVMVLDTVERLKEAIALYERLGFQRRDAYIYNPEPDVVYMEIPLVNS